MSDFLKSFAIWRLLNRKQSFYTFQAKLQDMRSEETLQKLIFTAKIQICPCRNPFVAKTCLETHPNTSDVVE